MIVEGQIAPIRLPRIPITVEGGNGVRLDFDALLDTGFNGELVVPSGTVRRLGLLATGQTAQITFGDGSTKRDIESYNAVVYRGNQPIRFYWVHEFGREAKVGMKYIMSSESDCVRLTMCMADHVSGSLRMEDIEADS